MDEELTRISAEKRGGLNPAVTTGNDHGAGVLTFIGKLPVQAAGCGKPCCSPFGITRGKIGGKRQSGGHGVLSIVDAGLITCGH